MRTMCVECNNPPEWVTEDKEIAWLFDEDRTYHLLAHLIDPTDQEAVASMVALAELIHLVSQEQAMRRLKEQFA